MTTPETGTPGAPISPREAAQRCWFDTGDWEMTVETALVAQRQQDAATDAAKPAPGSSSPRLSLALCGDHPGEVHAQILDHPSPGLDAWVCLRQLADVAEAGAAEITIRPQLARPAPTPAEQARQRARDASTLLRAAMAASDAYEAEGTDNWPAWEAAVLAGHQILAEAAQARAEEFPDGCSCLELEDGLRSADPDCPVHVKIAGERDQLRELLAEVLAAIPCPIGDASSQRAMADWRKRAGLEAQ